MTKEQFILELKEQQGPLRRFLLALCNGDSFEADDIAQEASVKAWISIDHFRGSSRFSTWLFKIAYNTWCDSMKGNGASCTIDCMEAKQQESDSESDEGFKYQDLYQAISSLSSNEKAVILLFYMEDKPIKEIASITGMPAGTIKSLLSRGRSKLKIELK